MIKYKGYTIFKEKSILGKTTGAVGTIQPNGSMYVHSRGYANTLSAKRACDAHFGRL